jgi:hypothetical protein
MASQTIVWVTIPNGFNGTRGRISVVVLPRLQPNADGTLGPFDFVDWPKHCGPGKIAFDVVFPGVRVTADIVSQPDSAKWTALFDKNTFVRPYELDANSGVFGSYPAAPLHAEIKSGYQRICEQSPIDRPAPADVAAGFSDVARLFDPASQVSVENSGTLTESEQQRVLLARSLFQPGATLANRIDQLVDLAKADAQQSAAALGARRNYTAIVPDTSEAMDKFVQLAVFLKQPRGAASASLHSASDTTLDFHQRLSALGDYPEMMRKLGLVIELEIDMNAIPEAELDAPSTIRVEPRFLVAPDHATVLLAPSTVYICKRASVFAAAPKNLNDGGNEIVGGFLNLQRRTPAGDSEFSIIQVDVDSSAMKTLDLVGRAVQGGQQGTGAQPQHGAMSPIRTSGISITRTSNARLLHEVLVSGFDNSNALVPGSDSSVRLFADDLIRGYRVDIRNLKSDAWHSLHGRVGTYEFLSSGERDTVTDEGTSQPNVVQPVADGQGPAPTTHDPSAANYVSESLFLWQGWSLAAPRPVDALPQPKESARVSTLPGTFNLKTTFSAKSLPRLRFGERYEIRARTVDLAGNSLSVDDATSALGAIPAQQRPVLPATGQDFAFQRFEPIASPVAVLRAQARQGDATDRIVARSTLSGTPADFTAANPDFLNTNERHIVSPKTFQMMAEMSGRFDASIGTRTNFAQTYALASRESGSLGDPDGQGTPTDPVHPEPSLIVPYLPDPFVAGAAFRDLPGMPEGTIARSGPTGLTFAPLPGGDRANQVGSIVLIDFGETSAWPALQSFRLRLSDGDGQPVWDAVERVLTVSMPKGEMQTVRMSSYPAEGHLDQLGMWNWIAEGMTDAGREEFRQLALSGLLWMVTPYRELTLIHAVPQPVQPPVMQSPFPQPDKIVNGTYAGVGGKVQVHAASTERIELMAHWQEFTQDPPLDCEAHVFTASLPLSTVPGTETSAMLFDPTTGTLEFVAPSIKGLNDVIQRKFTQLSQAAADCVQTAAILHSTDARCTDLAKDLRDRVAETFGLVRYPSWPNLIPAMEKIGDFSDFSDQNHVGMANLPPQFVSAGREVGDAAGEVANEARAALDTLASVLGVRHEFGDTKHRNVDYRVVGTTRFAEFFPPAMTANPAEITQTSNITTLAVVSSAPPAPAVVQYIVPAFKWTRPSPPTPPDYQSSRSGGGLRIYLDSPWFLTGEDELLGVILSFRVTPATEPFVTHWGRDPLWHSPQISDRPTQQAFRNPKVVGSAFLHAEDLENKSDSAFPFFTDPAASSFVTVVGYEVKTEDGRCFCDIELDPGVAYCPFVRLALARYQPNAIRGFELSRVVVADFIQLMPDRSVSLVESNDDVYEVTVTGTTHDTPTDPVTPGTQTGNQVSIRVQQRIPGASDDAGWFPADDQVTVTANLPAASGKVLWQGSISLPTGRQPGQFRLLIEELESFQSVAPTPPVVSRVVFAETVEL